MNISYDLLPALSAASRVPDELYRSVRPMLAVSHGRLLALSTPFGQRGWFHDEWHGSGPWRRVKVPWQDCPRITADFIAEERRAKTRNASRTKQKKSRPSSCSLIFLS